MIVFLRNFAAKIFNNEDETELIQVSEVKLERSKSVVKGTIPTDCPNCSHMELIVSME